MLELYSIIEAYYAAQAKGLRSVLASVVALEGSSYRQPGVRMLLIEDGSMVGALSGGCVEKEVLRQAQDVFIKGLSKVMTYEGRYKLGCKGTLYILLEEVRLSTGFRKIFYKQYVSDQKWNLHSFFNRSNDKPEAMGTYLVFSNLGIYGFSGTVNYNYKPYFFNVIPKKTLLLEIVIGTYEVSLFSQKMKPPYQLYIFGSEHDAHILAKVAVTLGWHVSIIRYPESSKILVEGEDNYRVREIAPSDLKQVKFSQKSAVVLMTHSFSKDLAYLLELEKHNFEYLGILGPVHRREELLQECLERGMLPEEDFLEKIYAPVGLDLGAETPQEIAYAIVAEILAVKNKREPKSLRQKTGSIHVI
ncbi:XdhC family protein [Aquimarina sp. U1-2]|uniref:XdhC family protein n=1 Tax=Aquimarina sp. U1-2 TaxID=2823141 RepID=UPI001AEC9EF9|nr:XdhC/CoxI family protein [Aquimarina sp. U1-2]MBP2831063.1 XdhC family protein [Aquimarina sp. U1-2]